MVEIYLFLKREKILSTQETCDQGRRHGSRPSYGPGQAFY